MAVTYENILKAQIGRECKDYLADLLDSKSNYDYNFIEVMEVEIGSELFMDRLYNFNVNIGIIDKDYRNPGAVTVNGTIGTWGINIGVIRRLEDEKILWFTNPELNVMFGIQEFKIK